MTAQLTRHFTLDEFLPSGMRWEDAPADIAANIARLASEFLEPLREVMGVPIVIHNGWRPPPHNAIVGGASHSDHLTGSAADFHVAATLTEDWETATRRAFDWLRLNVQFGQLIWEDHRQHYGIPGKLWVHIALRTAKHDGTDKDPNRTLTSSAPGLYSPWKGDTRGG